MHQSSNRGVRVRTARSRWSWHRRAVLISAAFSAFCYFYPWQSHLDRPPRDCCAKDRRRGLGIGGRGGAGGPATSERLWGLEPAEALKRLERDDPFGTRTFGAELTRHETDLGRALVVDEVRRLFPCPTEGQKLMWAVAQRSCVSKWTCSRSHSRNRLVLWRLVSECAEKT
jgi:hypothetical protein